MTWFTNLYPVWLASAAFLKPCPGGRIRKARNASRLGGKLQMAHNPDKISVIASNGKMDLTLTPD